MSGQPVVGALPLALNAPPPERLARLFDTHHERLYRLARRLSASTDDGLDLLQDTFLRAAQSIDSIPISPSGEEGWLVRVMVNVQRDMWRQTAVRTRHARTAQPTEVIESHEDATIARSVVHGALSALPPRRRAVVVMHELEELPVRDIAALLGITTVTVRWHLSRGRRALARVLHTSR